MSSTLINWSFFKRTPEIVNFLSVPRVGIFSKVISLEALLSFCISIFLFSNFSSWIGSSEVISISPILLPSEILSPTLTLIILTLPENGEGTSTLDLSLSRVIIPSFFFIF
jgi:hypothetical protein